MQMQPLLDSLPIPYVFGAFTLGALLVYECGYRIGRWWQIHTPEEKEGPTTMMVGSLLALLAFLLAVTMGMASDRFEARRGLILAEANAIGTTYLRAGYLPEASSNEVRRLLREYVPLRIVSYDESAEKVRARIVQSAQLQTTLWSIAEELARTAPESQVIALFIESLNEMIDLHESRIAGSIYGRVPETVLFLLLISSMLTLVMVGYNAGLRFRRSTLAAVVMIFLLGAVLSLLIDLDRTREGFLTVKQQPLIDLAEQIGAPLPATAHD
jgi:hypothetical protein